MIHGGVVRGNGTEGSDDLEGPEGPGDGAIVLHFTSGLECGICEVRIEWRSFPDESNHVEMRGFWPDSCALVVPVECPRGGA